MQSRPLKNEAPAQPQHAARLGMADGAVGKEHRTELAADDIQRGIFERQLERIRLLPFDVDAAGVPAVLAIGAVALPGGGAGEHGLIEVCHHVSRTAAEPERRRSRDHTTPLPAAVSSTAPAEEAAASSAMSRA